jgi:hypothetical protein
MRTLLLLLAATVFLPACTSAITADAESDPSTDFREFRTFAWLPAAEERPPDAFAHNPAADRRLRQLIERHLEKRGLERTNDTPDLYVTYITGIRDLLGETVWGRGYGGAGGNSGQTFNRRDATLIVDLIRVEPRQLVWRGWAKATIDQFQNSEPVATEALEKMFAKYPGR